MKKLFFSLSIIITVSGKAYSNAGYVNGPPWKQYADSARLFQQQKNHRKAIEYYLKANELLKKDSAFTMSYFRNNNDIGDVFVAMGQYGKAEPFYSGGLQIIEKIQGNENADYASSCNN